MLHGCLSFYLEMGGGTFDDIVKSELRLFVKKLCGLLLNTTLFRMKLKSDKTNATVTLSQSSIMIYILSAIRRCRMF